MPEAVAWRSFHVTSGTVAPYAGVVPWHCWQFETRTEFTSHGRPDEAPTGDGERARVRHVGSLQSDSYISRHGGEEPRRPSSRCARARWSDGSTGNRRWIERPLAAQ